MAHHVMVRGIERRSIFNDRADYENFLGRLDRLIPELGFRCFAWALLPNHAHLALQTGPVPLARLMARLGTGYARYFNERHGRVGHLLQNRYKSRGLIDDDDLLGVVLYVHRNPVEAGLVEGSASLGGFPWCGHGAVSGERSSRPFEAPGLVLSLLSGDPDEARRQLRLKMAIPTGNAEARTPTHLAEEKPESQRLPTLCFSELLRQVSKTHGVCIEQLHPRFRSRRVVRARSELAQRAVRELGLSNREVARALGISDSAVSRALLREPSD